MRRLVIVVLLVVVGYAAASGFREREFADTYKRFDPAEKKEDLTLRDLLTELVDKMDELEERSPCSRIKCRKGTHCFEDRFTGYCIPDKK